MMTEADIYGEFERLWDSFAVCVQAADHLNSPNPEDDPFVKVAIVGFLCHDQANNWRYDHYAVTKKYLIACEELGDSPNTKRFNMLALGDLLGLYSSGKIDERVYRIGYALLPGFVMGKGDSINRLGVNPGADLKNQL
jgi:hypothetical protein